MVNYNTPKSPFGIKLSKYNRKSFQILTIKVEFCNHNFISVTFCYFYYKYIDKMKMSGRFLQNNVKISPSFDHVSKPFMKDGIMT